MLNIAMVQILVRSVLGLFPQNVPTGVIGFIASLTEQLPGLVAAGIDIQQYTQTQLGAVRAMLDENRDPTQQEWEALNASMTAELDKLRASAATP